MAAICILVTAACCCDYRKKKIPNMLIALTALADLIWCFWTDGLSGAGACLVKILFTGALMYPLFAIGTLGAGDVKLFGVAAGTLPFCKILFFLFSALLISAAVSLVKFIKYKNFGQRIRYFSDYASDVLRCGRWKLYMENGAYDPKTRLCISGPVLLSLLMYMGGVY